MIIIFGRLTFNAYICSIKMKQLKQNDMTTLRNTEKNLFASIVNEGDYGFTVYFGYRTESNGGYGGDNVTNRKNYKSEKMATKKANEFLNK